MIYRLSTEDVNRDTILELLAKHEFEAATLIPAIGVWKGQLENSLLIEIESYGDPHVQSRVRSLAMAIRIANKQEAVLVQKISTISSLATASKHAFDDQVVERRGF